MGDSEELKEDDRPSNTLEHFSEKDKVMNMIENLKKCYSESFEKEYEQFTELLSRYQEQPHLLDAHLDTLVAKLIELIRDPENEVLLIHASFKYLYTIAKVRTYKALVKFLPHELSDLDFVLDSLERQDAKNPEHWETRYGLLLWLSILVLNPFHMARLDAFDSENDSNQAGVIQNKPKMMRIFDICKKYSENNDTCSNVAAFLSAKYFIRADIKEIYLGEFLQYVMDQNSAETVDAKFGQLAAVAAILKHGKRDDLYPYADTLLKWILSCNYKTGSDFLKYKYYIKIIQRIGLIYLKPRLAAWRYKRGSRSLVTNLAQAESCEMKVVERTDNADGIWWDKFDFDAIKKCLSGEEGDEMTVPDAIEDVIEELLQGLRSSSSGVRWSAAKGVGRVTNRLPKSLGDEVVGSIVDILNPLEPHEAWHGASLAIAELAKRGLLLPYRLVVMVPLLRQALFYDEMKGYMSVGMHIRDAACYMCWAFARAFNPKDLEPFVNDISTGLLTVAAFDREINCRRAASAAFQESVGRLGNFPHGIDISINTDFYSVGLRTNSYLNISNYIAQYDEYKKPLIDHLVEKKLGHWDKAVRELSAKAMHNLTKRHPHYMCDEILPVLFKKVDLTDIAIRHGSILAIGEICLALHHLEDQESMKLFTNQITSELNDLVPKFVQRDQFRGLSGDIMKQCCSDFIRNCSLAKIEATKDCLGKFLVKVVGILQKPVHNCFIDIFPKFSKHFIATWEKIIDKCLINKNSAIRDSATSALTALCISYYDCDERKMENAELLGSYLKGAENDLEEHSRMGYTSAIGCLPKFMIIDNLSQVITRLIVNAVTSTWTLQFSMVDDFSPKTKSEMSKTNNWSESRRDSVKALANVVQTIGFKSAEEGLGNSIANPLYFKKICNCYLLALGEYTLDNRGDIGAWVREAAMCALYALLTTCPQELLKPEFVHEVMLGLAQQAVEKIDRTRGLAGRLFCNLVHVKPTIPHIRRHEALMKIFPEDSLTVLWLFADRTFPLFCEMLELKEYSERVLLGLIASIGQLTESLIKYSSTSFFTFLRAHTKDIPRICSEIISLFTQNLLNERVTYPMLNFLDSLLSSATVTQYLLDENSGFADQIFSLTSSEIKGHKKLYKLVSSINVFCQLIQVPRMRAKVFGKMSVFLGLTHVHIRKSAAAKLYEALVIHGDSCGLPASSIDDALEILAETDWSAPLSEVRPVRRKLFEILELYPPTPIN